MKWFLALDGFTLFSARILLGDHCALTYYGMSFAWLVGCNEGELACSSAVKGHVRPSK
jgi:hypothetical protein